jgi:hypothetical protein
MGRPEATCLAECKALDYTCARRWNCPPRARGTRPSRDYSPAAPAASWPQAWAAARPSGAPRPAPGAAGRGGKTPAQPALGFGGRRHCPGARPRPASATRRLAVASESAMPGSLEKGVHAARPGHATPGTACSSGTSVSRHSRRWATTRGVTSAVRCSATMAARCTNTLRARGVELQQLAHVRRHAPAASPASPGASRSSGNSWKSCAPPPAGRRAGAHPESSGRRPLGDVGS